MEIFRSAGIQEKVDIAAEKEFRQNGAIVSVESLAAEDVTFFFRNFNERRHKHNYNNEYK